MILRHTPHTRSWADGASRKHPLADYDVFFFSLHIVAQAIAVAPILLVLLPTLNHHTIPPPEAGTKNPKLKKEIIMIPRRMMNHVKNGMIHQQKYTFAPYTS